MMKRITSYVWANEFLTSCLFCAVFMALFWSLGYSFLCWQQSKAKTRAKALVGQHTFKDCKYYLFQGRVVCFDEIYAGQPDDTGVSIPVRTEFGGKVSSLWFTPFNKAKRAWPIQVRITYSDVPENKWAKDGIGPDYYDEGSYLRFEIIGQNEVLK